MGKGNKEKFSLKTPTATIGMRGTTFIAQYVPAPPPGGGSVPGMAPSLAPGLHLNVTDGAIIVTNNGGSLGFQAGQFGYVPNLSQPPVIVPGNPGIQFAPPPAFDVAAAAGGPASAIGIGKENEVDCVVR